MLAVTLSNIQRIFLGCVKAMDVVWVLLEVALEDGGLKVGLIV
jgi:hypothetical protein